MAKFVVCCSRDWRFNGQVLVSNKNDHRVSNFICFSKAHQDQNRSYKEVCAPVIERCHFLFNELRPAIGNEVNTMSRSKLLKSTSRWKWAIAKVVENNKSAKCECKCVCWPNMMMQIRKDSQFYLISFWSELMSMYPL